MTAGLDWWHMMLPAYPLYIYGDYSFAAIQTHPFLWVWQQQLVSWLPRNTSQPFVEAWQGAAMEMHMFPNRKEGNCH